MNPGGATPGVSHIILRVSDMDRSVEFYRDAVGLPAITTSPAFSFFEAGPIKIALNVGDPPPSDTTTEIVLETGDILEAFDAMRSRGVPFEIAPRPVTADSTRELHAAHFRDPDGHLWSLTGWVEAGRLDN